MDMVFVVATPGCRLDGGFAVAAGQSKCVGVCGARGGSEWVRLLGCWGRLSGRLGGERSVRGVIDGAATQCSPLPKRRFRDIRLAVEFGVWVCVDVWV